jgi:hypothetical protein
MGGGEIHAPVHFTFPDDLAIVKPEIAGEALSADVGAAPP